MSELACWAWLSGLDSPWIALCSGVALLMLMMLSSAALLFREILDAAVGRQRAPADRLTARDGHACEECSGGVGPGSGPGASTTDPSARY